jgi:hypothetical protein
VLYLLNEFLEEHEHAATNFVRDELGFLKISAETLDNIKRETPNLSESWRLERIYKDERSCVRLKRRLLQLDTQYNTAKLRFRKDYLKAIETLNLAFKNYLFQKSCLPKEIFEIAYSKSKEKNLSYVETEKLFKDYVEVANNVLKIVL